METVLKFLGEVIASAGGLALIICTFGKKLLSFAYEIFKEKLTVDIEKDRLKFAHDLNERLKYVEENLARASHAATTQYDIEIKKYEEILQVICASYVSVEDMCKGCFMDDREMQNQKMRELREHTLAKVDDCIRTCEESSSFIRPEICNAMRQYVHYIQELERIHRQYIYSIQRDGSIEDKERAEYLIGAIEQEKQGIQDSICTRLEQFEAIAEVP